MIIYYTDGFEGGREESHRLLERSIAEYTGDAAKAKELAGALKTLASGKPYIEGFRHFSISHTGSFWAVLIEDCECGLDIQLAKNCDVMAIARRIFDREDVEVIGRFVQAGQDAAAEEKFFQLWTRREALTKALGGSVFDEALPAVSSGHAIITDGRKFSLMDLRLPEIPELFASICIENYVEDMDITPVFVRLNGKQ